MCLFRQLVLSLLVSFSSLLVLFALPTTSADGPCSPVYLTVTSSDPLVPNQLELNWDFHCGQTFDWVGLFQVDPSIIKTATPIVKVFINEHPSTYYKTNVSLGEITLPGGWEKDKDHASTAIPGSHCLSYWIAGYREDVIVEINCLKAYPTWMNDHREQLNDLPLSKLLLPGTHNSGSFYSKTVLADGLHRFVLTQDYDVWSQLVFGIRYLDIRIGYYEPIESEKTEGVDVSNTSKFWINHDLIKVTPLVPILRDIKRFVQQSKGEIVILDIHRLPVGFYLINDVMRNKTHKMLVELLYEELGDVAVNFKNVNSPSPNVHMLNGAKLKNIWETQKNLIICYPEELVSKNADWLWPPLRQMWGDKQKAADLKQYIDSVLQHPPPTNPNGNPLWAIMAQLTANAFDILFKPTMNLRTMAELVNKNLTNWMRNDWWSKANIITTDFFLGNNLIETSINSIQYKTTYKKNEG